MLKNPSNTFLASKNCTNKISLYLQLQHCTLKHFQLMCSAVWLP